LRCVIVVLGFFDQILGYILSVMDVPNTFLNRKRYDQIQAEFDQALRWYDGYVPPAIGRRFAKYQQNIAALVEAYDAGKIADLLQRISEEELTNSLAEATELIAIEKGLSSLTGQDKPLTELIRKITNGPEYARQEDQNRSTNAARNFAFEMLLAAYSVASGFKLDLAHIADLAIDDDGNDLFIEAKRPTTRRNVKSNVN
jgi:hypothetical protein